MREGLDRTDNLPAKLSYMCECARCPFVAATDDQCRSRLGKRAGTPSLAAVSQGSRLVDPDVPCEPGSSVQQIGQRVRAKTRSSAETSRFNTGRDRAPGLRFGPRSPAGWTRLLSGAGDRGALRTGPSLASICGMLVGRASFQTGRIPLGGFQNELDTALQRAADPFSPTFISASLTGYPPWVRARASLNTESYLASASDRFFGELRCSLCTTMSAKLTNVCSLCDSHSKIFLAMSMQAVAC